MSYLLSPSLPFRTLMQACLLLGLAVSFSACGGKDEVKSVDGGVPTPPPAKETSTIPEGMTLGEIVPESLDVLAFMPEEAQIAFAQPAIPQWRDRVLPLMKAFSPEDEAEEAMAEAIFELGDEIGIQAETYEELTAALGVDPLSPIAVFVDFSRSVGSTAAMTTGSEESDDDTDEVEDPEEPAWATVLGLTDLEKARNELERIIQADDELRALDESTETIAGLTLSVRGEYAYFTTATHMVLGYHNLVAGAARRYNAPAKFRYGTTECPAKAADESVLLVYGNRITPFMEQVVPALMDDSDDMALPMIQAQMEQYKGMFSDGAEEDPMVGTLSWVDDTVELLWRVDVEKNPGMMEAVGEAQPLRLARYVPDNTLALLSFRFNDVFKAQLMEDIVPAAAEAGGGNELAIASQVIPQLGDELTVAVTDVVDGTIGAYILLGLARAEATQGLLQMFVPMEGVMEHKGFTINTVAVPAPVPLYMSFVDDFAVAASSLEGMKTVIDNHVDKKLSGAYAKMTPPFDMSVPRYQAVTLNTQGLHEAVSATVASMGGDMGDSGEMVEGVVKALREVRSVSELDGHWLVGRVSLFLNDLESIEKSVAEEAAPAEAL